MCCVILCDFALDLCDFVQAVQMTCDRVHETCEGDLAVVVEEAEDAAEVEAVAKVAVPEEAGAVGAATVVVVVVAAAAVATVVMLVAAARKSAVARPKARSRAAGAMAMARVAKVRISSKVENKVATGKRVGSLDRDPPIS